jgi:hypothetical protein
LRYIHVYARGSFWAGILYRVFQTLAVVFGALSSFLILFGDTIPKPIQALPASLAAVAAAVAGLYGWQQNFARKRATVEALQGELLKFDTRTSPAYGPKVTQEAALDTFVQRVVGLIQSETKVWSAQMGHGGGENTTEQTAQST